jgi:hypothetical protein
MTTYILDIQTSAKTQEMGINGYTGGYVTYFFKIDINGNVDISKKFSFNSHDVDRAPIQKVISINDNIPIPNYFIIIIKSLINRITLEEMERFTKNKNHFESPKFPSGRNNHELTERYWEIVVDTIKRIKQEVKDLVETPHGILDVKTQLNTYESKIKQQEEHISELNKKIENIQTVYFDALNDNKNLKEIIKAKDTKQTEIECEINKVVGDLNVRKQLEEYNNHEQQKMEELEKERVWYDYKLKKKLYTPSFK